MPHERKRNLAPILATYLKGSPIVGVIGHRQTGKTTLCTHYSSSSCTLDREADLHLCESSPEEFIRNRNSPFMIDECQLAPRLFPALKEFVRTQKRVGQFLLSGSVRFSSRKAIHESLTGRILLAELLPLTWSESHELPINPLLMRIHTQGIQAVPTHFESRVACTEEVILHYLNTGGLPGICFTRSDAMRASKFKTHIDTVLDRDLRMIVETSLPKMTLLALLGALAATQGKPLNWESVRRDSGISVLTLKKLFSAFEALFILRPMSLIGKATPDTFYFEDTGLAHYLIGNRTNALGLQDFSHFLFCNLRETYHYRQDTPYSVQTYRTRGGAFVPLIFQAFKHPLAILPSLDRQPTLSSLRSAESFLADHKNAQALIVHFGTESRVHHSRLASVPWNWLI